MIISADPYLPYRVRELVLVGALLPVFPGLEMMFEEEANRPEGRNALPDILSA
jgi:hypothetical protein